MKADVIEAIMEIIKPDNLEVESNPQRNERIKNRCVQIYVEKNKNITGTAIYKIVIKEELDNKGGRELSESTLKVIAPMNKIKELASNFNI